MKRASFAQRQQTSVRALKWLVDVAGGTSEGGPLNEYLTGSRRGYAFLSVVRFLVRNGWVEVREPPDKFNVNKCTLFVTDAGRVWRDYFDWEPGRLKLNRLQLHARIRALEMALAPLIRMHEQYEAARCLTSAIATEQECRVANTVLHSPNEGSIVYPWTPGYVGAKYERTEPAGNIDGDHATDSPDRTRERNTD